MDAIISYYDTGCVHLLKTEDSKHSSHKFKLDDLLKLICGYFHQHGANPTHVSTIVASYHGIGNVYKFSIKSHHGYKPIIFEYPEIADELQLKCASSSSKKKKHSKKDRRSKAKQFGELRAKSLSVKIMTDKLVCKNEKYKMTSKQQKDGYFGYGLQIGLFGVKKSYFNKNKSKNNKGLFSPLWDEWKRIFVSGFDDWITSHKKSLDKAGISLETRYLYCYNEYNQYCCDIGINQANNSIAKYYGQNYNSKYCIKKGESFQCDFFRNQSKVVFYKADDKDRITNMIEEIEVDVDYVYFLAVACVGCNCNQQINQGMVLEVRVFA